jgi:acetoacetyl-CoA synthetase
LHGATIVLYSGSPTHPDPTGLWTVAGSTRASGLTMGSAFVRGCLRVGARLGDVRGLERLRLVNPTGSPLTPASWSWLTTELGEGVRVDSTCGSTEVCTAFFGGSRLLPVRSGEISCSSLGVKAEAWDAIGRPVVENVGEFVITAPMPSMPVALWDDPDAKRIRGAYFDRYPGAWCQGDSITIRADGAVVVRGRSDAMLSRGWVRMRSAEIYGVVEQFDEIADSLVVGVEQADGGYYMPLFVTLSDDAELDDGLVVRLREEIRRSLSPRHVPDEVIRVPAIPLTPTGRKLEVPVKRMLQGACPAEAAAYGAIDRPEALEWYAQFTRRRGSEQAAMV